MTALSRLLIEIVRTTLCSIAAHGKKNVHIAGDQVVHSFPDVHGPTRSAENRPAMLMNVINKCRRDLHRLGATLRIETAVPSAETQDFTDAVAVMKLEKQ